MKRIILAFCWIFLLASCSNSSQPINTEAPESPSLVEKEHTVSTSESKVIDPITARIGPDMTDYRFELRENPPTFEPDYWPYDIDVFDQTGTLVQTINLYDFHPTEEEVYLIDFNFDGYLDILKPGLSRVRNTYGLTWNVDEGCFVEFRQLPSAIIVNGGRKQIHETYSVGGSKRIYEFIDDELTLVAELEIQMFESRMSAVTYGDEPRTIVEYSYSDGYRQEKARYNFTMPLVNDELRNTLVEKYYTKESYWNLENIGSDDFDSALVLRVKKEEHTLSPNDMLGVFHRYEGVYTFYNSALTLKTSDAMTDIISFAKIYSHSIDFYNYWPPFFPPKNSMFALEGAVPNDLSYVEFKNIIDKTSDVSILDSIYENPINFSKDEYESLLGDTFFVKKADIDNCGVDEITLFTVADRGGSGLSMHNSIVFKKAGDGSYDIIFALAGRYMPFYHDGQYYYIEIMRDGLGFDVLHIDSSWNIERAVISAGRLIDSSPILYCYLDF